MKVVDTPVDTGRKLNVHKTFRRGPGRLLNVLCTFNIRPVSTGTIGFQFKAKPLSNQIFLRTFYLFLFLSQPKKSMQVNKNKHG